MKAGLWFWDESYGPWPTPASWGHIILFDEIRKAKKKHVKKMMKMVLKRRLKK